MDLCCTLARATNARAGVPPHQRTNARARQDAACAGPATTDATRHRDGLAAIMASRPKAASTSSSLSAAIVNKGAPLGRPILLKARHGAVLHLRPRLAAPSP